MKPVWRVAALAALVTITRLAWNALIPDYPLWAGRMEAWNAERGVSWPHGDWTDAFLLRMIPYTLLDALGLEGVFWARFPQTVLIIPTAIGAYYLGERLKPGVGYAAGVLVSVNPFVFAWYGRAMPDAWLSLGVLLCVLATITLRRTPENAATASAWYGLLWVAGFSLSVLAKPAGVLAGLTWFYLPLNQKVRVGVAVGVFLAALSVAYHESIQGVIQYVTNRPSNRFDTPFFKHAPWIIPYFLVAGLFPSFGYGLFNAKPPLFIVIWAFVALTLIDSWGPGSYYALPAAPLAMVAFAAAPRVQRVLGERFVLPVVAYATYAGSVALLLVIELPILP